MNKLLLSTISVIAFAYNSNAQTVLSTNAYCTTNLHAANCAGGYLRYVEIDGTSLHNSSACNNTSTSYVAYAASDSMTATLVKGSTYTLIHWAWIQADVGMWIDYNQDGSFASSEFTLLKSNSSVWEPDTISITIPSTALTGTTTMRIRARSTNFGMLSTYACTNFGSAETEDYVLSITAPAGVNESIKESSISLYPNPAQNNVNLSFKMEDDKEATVSILDLNGRVIYSEVVNAKVYNKTFDTQLFSAGVYVLQLKSADQVISRKLVVTK